MTIVSDTKIPNRLVVFECNHCKIHFERGTKTKPKIDYKVLLNDKHYCSLSCAYSGREIKYLVATSCNQCNEMFDIPRAKLSTTNFCSKGCYWVYKKTDSRCKSSRAKCSEERKEKISKANKGNQFRLGAVLSDETKSKISKGNKGKLIGEKNPMWGKTHTQEVKETMSEVVSREMISGKRKAYGKNNHLSGQYVSTKNSKEMHYRSSWELATMKWLDLNSNVQSYQYESIRIPYLLEEGNRSHLRHYVPDFLIEFTSGEKELWELKPEKLSQNEKTKAKVVAAKNYCDELGIEFRLLHKQNLLDMKIV